MAEKGRKEKTFTHEAGDLVLVKWNDGMVYFAKIKRIDWRKRKCVVIFDDRSTDDALFSQIHSVDETTTDIICIKCKRDDSESPNEIVLCDSCGIGFHQKCHSPMIPASALELDNPWQCIYCQKKTRNPYLTESIDVMQILFDEGDDMEVDIKKEKEDEEEVQVKQEITSSDEESMAQTSSVSLLPTRKKKGRRPNASHVSKKSSSKSRPLQQLRKKLIKLGHGSVNHENNSRKRRGKTDDESSGSELPVKRRISTVESHTVSVQNVSAASSILNQQAVELSEHDTLPSDDDDDNMPSQSSEQIGPPPKKKPRSLRVSLTLPPSVETSPLVTPANKTAVLGYTISPPHPSVTSTLKTASEKLETVAECLTVTEQAEQTTVASTAVSSQRDTSEITSSTIDGLLTVTDTVTPITNQAEMQVDENIAESDEQRSDKLTTSVPTDLPEPTSSNQIIDMPSCQYQSNSPVSSDCKGTDPVQLTGEANTKIKEKEDSQIVISSVTSPTSVTTTEPTVAPSSQEKPENDNQSLVKVSPGITHLKPKRSTVIHDATTPPSGPSPLECLQLQIKNVSAVKTSHVSQTTCTATSISLPTTIMQSTGIVSSAPPLRSRSQHSRKPIAPSRTIPVSTTIVNAPSRTIPVSTAIVTAPSRIIPVSTTIVNAPSRTIPVSTAIVTAPSRTIPVSTTIVNAPSRTIPVSTAIVTAPSRTIPVSTTIVTPIRPRQRKNSNPQNMIIISPSPSPPNVPVSSGVLQPPQLAHSGQNYRHQMSSHNPLHSTNLDDVAFSPDVIAATRSKMIPQEIRSSEHRLTHPPALKHTMQRQSHGVQTHTQPLHHRIEGAQTHTRPIRYRSEGNHTHAQPLHHRNEGVQTHSQPLHHGNEVRTHNSAYTNHPHTAYYRKAHPQTTTRPSVDNRVVPVALTPTTINATGEAATVYTLVPASHVSGSHVASQTSYPPNSRPVNAVPMPPHVQMTGKNVSPITSPVLRSQPTDVIATSAPRVVTRDLYSPATKSGVVYSNVQNSSKSTGVVPTAVPYYTIMEVQPPADQTSINSSNTPYQTVHLPTVSTTKPYAVVSAIPTQANSSVIGGAWSPPPRSPPASLKIPPAGPKKIINVSTPQNHLATQFVKHTSRPTMQFPKGQGETQGVNQLRQEATSELTQRLHFFSSKYKKDFDSLSEENLVGIFHDALRKFHNNSKKYEEYVRTLCEKKTRAPNAEVFSPLGTPVQVRRGISKTPQTIVVNQSSPQLPVSPTTPASVGSNVVYISHSQPSTLPMPPRYQQLVSSGHQSTDVAQRSSYQVHTNGVFVPPTDQQSEGNFQHPVAIQPAMPQTQQLNYVQAVAQQRGFVQPQIVAQSQQKHSYLLTQPPGTPLKSGSILVRPIAPSTVVQPVKAASIQAPQSKTILKSQDTTSVQKESKPSRVCSRCGKDATYLCSGCHDEWYCGRECQLKAWDEHAEHCKS